MFCQNCGTKNDDTSIFCYECGTRLDKDGAEQQAENGVVNSAASEQNDVQQNDMQKGSVQQNDIQQGDVQQNNAQPNYVQPNCVQQNNDQQNVARPAEPARAVTPPSTQAARQAAVKPKKKMSIASIIVLLEVIAVIAILVAVPNVLKNTFSPQKAAELYFVSLVNGDYEKAYSLLDIDENEFINQESFANYCKKNDFRNISNYEVITASKSKAESGFDFYEDEYAKDSDSNIGKTITIGYRNKGDESGSIFMVNMIKETGKKYLFFDDWSVGYSSLVCRNYSIITANGAKLLLDGVKVPQSYLFSSNDDYAVYNIPALFIGQHSVEITKDGMQPISGTIEASYDSDSTDFSYMYFTEEEAQKLQNLAVENMKQIYAAASEGRDFSEIKKLFTSDAQDLYNIEYGYMDLVDYFQNEEGPTKIVFSNVDAESNTSETSVDVSFYYELDYNNRSWWSGELEKASYSGSDDTEFYFVNENGNWLMKGIGCSRLYYW